MSGRGIGGILLHVALLGLCGGLLASVSMAQTPNTWGSFNPGGGGAFSGCPPQGCTPNDPNNGFVPIPSTNTTTDPVGGGTSVVDTGNTPPSQWPCVKDNLDPAIMGEGADSDGDGLSDTKEAEYGTDPNLQDTDGDQECDGLEVSHGSDPLLSTDRLEDHMPVKPTINPVAGDVPLTGAVFDMSAFVDPDADNTVGLTTWVISQVDSATQVQASVMVMDWGPEVSGSALRVPDGVLQAGQTYTISARYEDNTKLSSLWADPVTFTTVPVNPQDRDSNGVADNAQVDTFIDTNGDGVDDHLEGIVPVFDGAGHSPVGVQVSQGRLDWAAVMPVSALPTDQRPQATMPYGLFDFRISGLPVDYVNPAQVQVTFYFSGTLPDNLHWFKYDPTLQIGNDFTDHITVADNQVTLKLRDGERQVDLDGLINGIIVDPSGPLLTTVPTGDTSTPGSQNTGESDTTGTVAAGSQSGASITPTAPGDTSQGGANSTAVNDLQNPARGGGSAPTAAQPQTSGNDTAAVSAADSTQNTGGGGAAGILSLVFLLGAIALSRFVAGGSPNCD